MEFNPDPLKQATEIIFSSKRNKPHHPPLFFNDIEVASAPEQKHLGLILTPNLSFSNHLDAKIKKANQNIGIIKHLSKYLPFNTLDQMYKTFSRSHLDYCDIIFHQASKISEHGQVLRGPPSGVRASGNCLFFVREFVKMKKIVREFVKTMSFVIREKMKYRS